MTNLPGQTSVNSYKILHNVTIGKLGESVRLRTSRGGGTVSEPPANRFVNSLHLQLYLRPRPFHGGHGTKMMLFPNMWRPIKFLLNVVPRYTRF